MENIIQYVLKMNDIADHSAKEPRQLLDAIAKAARNGDSFGVRVDPYTRAAYGECIFKLVKRV